MKKSIVALVLLSACSKTPVERVQAMCEHYATCFAPFNTDGCIEAGLRAYDSQSPSLKALDLQKVDSYMAATTCDAMQKVAEREAPSVNWQCLRKDTHCVVPEYQDKKMLLDF